MPPKLEIIIGLLGLMALFLWWESRGHVHLGFQVSEDLWNSNQAARNYRQIIENLQIRSATLEKQLQQARFLRSNFSVLSKEQWEELTNLEGALDEGIRGLWRVHKHAASFAKHHHLVLAPVRDFYPPFWRWKSDNGSNPEEVVNV